MLLNLEDIKNIIPHRDPMLLISEVESESETGIVGYWHLTGEEPFFKGHFPGQPIVPGVLLVESMAQMGAVKLLQMEQFKGRLPLFGGIKNARFRRPVRPGDSVRIELEIVKIKGPAGIGEGTMYVGDDVACTAEIKFFIQ